MAGISLCRLVRGVFAVLLLCSAFIDDADAVQFNQPDNQFDMVVGNDILIYWSYAAGSVRLALGGASLNNTGVNMTIAEASRKVQSYNFSPPPSIQTGLYFLQISDTLSYARSPLFTIMNYGNVTSGSPVQPTPTQPASNSITATPPASVSDKSSQIAQNVGIAIGATLAAMLNLGLNGYFIYRGYFKPRRAARKIAREAAARVRHNDQDSNDQDSSVTSQPEQPRVARWRAFQLPIFGGRGNKNSDDTCAARSDVHPTTQLEDERRGLLKFAAGQGARKLDDGQVAQSRRFGHVLLNFMSRPVKKDDPEARMGKVEESVSTLEQDHMLAQDHMLQQDHELERDHMPEQDAEDPPEYVSDDDIEESDTKKKECAQNEKSS